MSKHFLETSHHDQHRQLKKKRRGGGEEGGKVESWEHRRMEEQAIEILLASKEFSCCTGLISSLRTSILATHTNYLPSVRAGATKQCQRTPVVVR